MTENVGDSASAESERSSTSDGEDKAQSGLLVLLEPSSSDSLNALAEALGQTREAVGRVLLTRLLHRDEASDLVAAGCTQKEADGQATIPTTSEIYLASFQEESRKELGFTPEAEDLQVLGDLAARHRVPPGRVAELLLEAGLAEGGEALTPEDFQTEESASAGFLDRFRRKLGF